MVRVVIQHSETGIHLEQVGLAMAFFLLLILLLEDLVGVYLLIGMKNNTNTNKYLEVF